MYKEVQGVIVGVLNDYDLSIINNDGRELAREWAGTFPFMASALLATLGTNKKIAHIYGAYT